MNRVLYKALLWLHPPAFRKRFGGEMLWIFDEAGPHRVLAFFRDAVISVTRQMDTAFRFVENRGRDDLRGSADGGRRPGLAFVDVFKQSQEEHAPSKRGRS